MELHVAKMIWFFHALIGAIRVLWERNWLGVIVFFCFIVLFFLSFYILIISPIIFNFFIVPNIERKLGQKIGHRVIDEYFWLGKWINRQSWTAIYIMNRCYAWKFKKDHGLPTAKYFSRFPLKMVGYTIDQISSAEIFFSAVILSVGFITLILSIILGIILLFFKSYITLK